MKNQHMINPLLRLSRFCLLPASLLLASCAVGPDYERPQMNVPELFRGQDPTAASSTSMGDLAWSEVFRDPVLVGLISEGLANNYDLRIAAARVDEYRALAGVTRGALFPQIDLTAGNNAVNGSRLSDPSSAASDNTSRNYDAGLLLTWELDLFGRLRREDEAAVARWLASEEGRRSVVVTLIADIASAYFTLRQYDQELEVARRTLDTNTAQVKYYRDRLQGGASNRLEVDQAEANRAYTASRIPEFELRIAVQENLINLLLGRAPAPVPRGLALTEQAFPPDLPVGLPLQLLQRRPDVMQAEQALVAANANIGAAKALFFPNISITAATGGLAKEFSDLGDSDAAVWSAGVGVLQPLFNAGAIRFNYEAAQARFDQALAQYQKTVQNSFRETADAVVSIEKTRASRLEIEASVVALQDAAQLARARYQGGLSSYLDILIADQNLFSAELNLVEVRAAEFTSTISLYRALGGGWRTAAAEPPAGESADPAQTSQEQTAP